MRGGEMNHRRTYAILADKPRVKRKEWRLSIPAGALSSYCKKGEHSNCAAMTCACKNAKCLCRFNEAAIS